MLADAALTRFSDMNVDPQDASPSSRWQHPPSFYCPISQQVMHDPVVVSDGHTYERRHIERWLQERNTSPVSNEELPQKAVFPNHALRNAISEYFDQVFSIHRRAIRKNIRGQGEQDRFVSNEPLLHTIDALMQCSFLMNADLNAECVLRQIINEAKTLVGAEAASVFLVDAPKQELYSTVNSTGVEICISINTGIAGRVATTGEPLVITDAYAEERFNRSNDAKTGFRTRNILCVPLKLKKGGVIGVVQLINKTGEGVFSRSQALSTIPEPVSEPSECDESWPAIAAQESWPAFTSQDLQFLQVFASQAALALANSGGVRREGQATPLPESKEVDVHDDAIRNPKKYTWADEALSETEAQMPELPVRQTSGLSESSECNIPLDHAPVEDAPAVGASEHCVQEPSKVEAKVASKVEAKVASILNEAFQSWQFDVFTLADLTDNKPLSTLGMYLLERLGLVEEFALDTQKLEHFFVEIENGYDDANPYHNRAHAASVMHALHASLGQGGIANAIASSFNDGGSSRGRQGQLQRLACLLAAAMHDHEHLGLTNDFLVRSRHPRATFYNDQHVNEHHHAASAFAVLQRAECNFLGDMCLDEFRQLRSIVIDLVLGTDMASGGKIQKDFEDAFGEQGRESTRLLDPSVVSAKDAMLLLQMAMKCADLGHVSLAWGVHEKWVSMVEAEFFAQGDKEKAAGLPVSFLMDRDKPGCSESQVGFFQFVVLPLMRSLVQVAPSMQQMLDGAMANYRQWQGLDEVRNVIRPMESREDRTASKASASTDAPTQSESYTGDGDEPRRKRSGRTRQRAAKYWASVRCRTPSPEPCALQHHLQRC